MPSLRRASLLRRSVAIAGYLHVSAAGYALAQPVPASEPSAAPAVPLSPNELDPTKAFADRVILLVRMPGDDGVVQRLRADLRDSQWRIVEIRPDDRFEQPSLGASAEHERASAAVRVDARRGVIELWVLRPDGPVEETIGSSDEQQSEQVLALRGAEALRARGLLVSRPDQSGGEAANATGAIETKPVVDASPPPPSRSEHGDGPRLWLALGPGILSSPGGVGPLPFAEVGLRLDFAERWSLHASGLLPLTAQSIAADEGEADIRTSVVAGALDVEWARLPFGGFRSGAGAGAIVTAMSGTSDSAGFDVASETVTTLALLIDSSFHAELADWLRLRSSVVLGASLPEVSVRFGSREVASFGRPFFAASAVLEATPPR
jgi:hypothetical protein